VSHEVKPFSLDPNAAYQVQSSDGGLIVVAEPFITKEKAESAFTIDVTGRGFAPVLLVLENRTTDNVLLIKDNIELIDGRGKTHKPVSANVMASRFEHEKIVYPLGGLGLLPYVSAGKANTIMLEDWSSKELASERLLTTDQKTHGFVYFYLGRAIQALQDSQLIVPLVNMRTGERKTTALRIVAP
jgi:hypothetical protein